MGQLAVLLDGEPAALLHFYEYAAPTTSITSEALDLHTVSERKIPGDLCRNRHVLAGRKIVLGDLPQKSAGALTELRHSGHGYRRTGGRDGCLSRIPRPSRTLMRLLGSVGPVVSVGVSMAPRVPRAVPHRRPACRGSVIVFLRREL